MELPPEVKFIVSKIKERSAIKGQHASRYYVIIDDVNYTVRAKDADIDPITITTDDKKVGFGGYIIPTGAGPVSFQGELLEDEKGTTHKHMSSLAARVFNADKTGNLPYTTKKYGLGYLVPLIVGFYGLDGAMNHEEEYEMFITSDKIGLSSEDQGYLYLPVEFTQFLY
ncbi:hypothetical protein KAR91_55710 [Candidatus Pacearchaeota archaeon]|nr:hypothetical protein [Candidatus Pacearchaeota archaeon]